MYNLDKYFDLDYKEPEAKTKPKKTKQKETLLVLLLLGAGAYYYFLIHLPEEEKKKLEMQIQTDLDKVKNLKPEEYDSINSLLTTCQGYLLWSNGTQIQKLALKSKWKDLDSAIKWLKENKESEQEIKERLENEVCEKGRLWELTPHSWADKEVKKMAKILVGRYQEDAKMFPQGDKDENFRFTRAASYEIFFPPALQEHYEAGKTRGETNCKLHDKNEELIWTNTVSLWYQQAKSNPTRGNPDPTTRKDNNALFYGTPGTGKSATMKKLCFEVNDCPLVIIKGSSLTPNKQDYDAGIAPLQKFIYTISELEWNLVKKYFLERENNGEVHYILFVDECDQISNNSLIHDPNKLRFLKECLEGGESSRKDETNNLWVMATNHLKDIEKAVYREGRLSNPLDFSWTWADFLKYFDDVSADPKKYIDKSTFPTVNIPSLPSRWRIAGLNKNDNELVNKFNKFSFVKDFLGYDPQDPSKPKFWEVFITKNPDGKYETKEDETDDNDNPTGQKEKAEIEIGEFLEYFWQKKETSQLGSYEGEFENPRDPKIEEVLDNSLPEMANHLANSSNALNQSLENLRQEIEGLKQQIQLSANSGQLTAIQNNINTLFKLVGELRGKIE